MRTLLPDPEHVPTDGLLGPAKVLTERLAFPRADGSTAAGYLARPAHAKADARGVLVAGELFGLTAHVRDVCERLAARGHVVLAPDLYSRAGAAIELPHDPTGRAHGFTLLHRLDRDEVLADVGAALAHLRARGCPRVGMVGVSVGGHVAYLAATALPLDAVAVLYAGWLTTTEIPLGRPEPTVTRTPGITGRVLLLAGDADHAVGAEERREVEEALTAAGVRYEAVTYPGVPHGFLCDRRDTYAPAAAADAWRRIDALLA